MIDVVRDSIVFDLGYLSDSPMGVTGFRLATSEGTDFASFWAANKENAENALAKFKKDYGGIEE